MDTFKSSLFVFLLFASFFHLAYMNQNTSTAGPECVLCRRAFKYLYDYLKDEKTEAKIEEALDTMCDKLFPSKSRDGCENFVNKYSTQILTIILETTNPEEACMLLNLCVSSEKAEKEELEIVPLVKFTQPAVEVEDDSQICQACRTLFTRIHDTIEANESSIVDYLKTICKTCPAREKCEKIVEKHLEEIINMIETDTDPSVACPALRLCPSTGDETDNEREEYIEDNTEEIQPNYVRVGAFNKFKICVECQMITKLIQKELNNFHNEQDITNFVEKDLCERFVNQKVKETCVSFIAQYGDELLQLIAQRIFDPETMCERSLKVCPSKAFSEVNPLDEIVFNRAQNEETCDICTKLIDNLRSTTKTLSDNFETLGSKACSHESGTRQDKVCQAIVSLFTIII